MSNQIPLLTEGIGRFLGDWVDQAREQLTVVAPFIKRKALERLTSGVGASVELTVVTRWSVEEICAGASDLDVFDFVCDRPGSRMLIHPRLHAKVLLVDDTTAVVGSANITDAALGFAEQANAEMMAVLRPVPNRLFLFLMRMERESIQATEELRQQFEKAARIAPVSPAHPEIILPKLVAWETTHPFPRFRIPERLYQGYVTVVGFSNPETRAAMLCDLFDLALPDNLDEAEFCQRVGAALLADAMISAFDQFVARPRYFGEMAEWLKRRSVPAAHGQENRKLYLQTLIRWLLHFLPRRYHLEKPGYSELFGRVEGWQTRDGAVE
jgi:hypothetical protein